MKFLLSFLTFGMATASQLPMFGTPIAGGKAVKVEDVKASSPLGQKIMGKARKLEENGEVDFTWVADYSIKFQGCHHVSQWNEEADGEEDVRIGTKRLVRFRLCPSDECSATSGFGCSSDYGDYILDMNEFLEAYYEAVEEDHQYQCEYAVNYSCDCEDDDNKDDGFDRDFCEYDCYVAQGLDFCIENNPYVDDDQEQERFDLNEYVECQQADIQADDNRRRAEEDEEVQYFIGPYCAEQGGAIYLGVFTDETCTVFDEEDTYLNVMGKRLPYSSETVISMDCFSCKEKEDADQNNDGDNADEDMVIEMCENIYERAGKCEENLSAVDSQNANACIYIEGIKVVRSDGILSLYGSKANRTASVFIGIFVVAFVLLAAYVYYLKTKLDRASINLSD